MKKSAATEHLLWNFHIGFWPGPDMLWETMQMFWCLWEHTCHTPINVNPQYHDSTVQYKYADVYNVQCIHVFLLYGANIKSKVFDCSVIYYTVRCTFRSSQYTSTAGISEFGSLSNLFPFSNWLKPSWKKTQFESDKIITSVNQWYWFNIQLYDYYLLAGMVVMPSCPKCSSRRLHSKLLKQRLSKPKWLWKDENTNVNI